ncbi:unnamed protein product [Effrenium voratum]|nr:unnamed protein product [Effrenium voratum]
MKRITGLEYLDLRNFEDGERSSLATSQPHLATEFDDALSNLVNLRAQIFQALQKQERRIEAGVAPFREPCEPCGGQRSVPLEGQSREPSRPSGGCGGVAHAA